MNLNELIEYFEDKQKRYLDLTPISKKVTDAVLKELKGKKSILDKINDDMINEKKWCYRFGMWVGENCDVCAECLTAEKLQWNESDEWIR